MELGDVMKSRLLASALIGSFLMVGFASVANGNEMEIGTLPIHVDGILENLGLGTDAEGAPIYKDPNAPVEMRLQDLLSRMTLEEKIQQMATTWQGTDMRCSPDNTRLGIPGLKFVNGPMGSANISAPDGSQLDFTDGIPNPAIGVSAMYGPSTCFPASISRGASWNRTLEYLVGKAAAAETYAKGRNCFFAPTLNLVVFPEGGRNMETYGEDAYQVGPMAASFVKGVQSENVVCVAKHFACNNLDAPRNYLNVSIDDRTLNEIYLPHFKMVVQEGNVGSLMGAYNKINGVYCCENYYLLTQLLKNEWGFDGFLISDNGAMHSTLQSIYAGTDMELSAFCTYYSVMGQVSPLQLLVEADTVPEAMVNEAVTRILREKFEAGLFDHPATVNPNVVGCKNHTDLALRAAQEGIVLLKNDNNALPVHRDSVKKIAIIGADAKRAVLGGSGSSAVYPTYVVTLYDGIKNRAGPGIEVIYDNGSNAKQAAASADVAIVVCGLTSSDEGEGNDRETLAMDAAHEQMINDAASGNKRCVVILEAGGPITMSNWVGNVAGVLMAWYAGQEGGNATADIIFGDISPSGKLPITFPKSEDQRPIYVQSPPGSEVTGSITYLPFIPQLLPSQVTEIIGYTAYYPYYHGYRYFEKYNLEPLFPFGYGLSYTSFEYSNLKIDKSVIGQGGKVKVSVDIENTGDIAGAEVVQLYIGYNGSAVERSLKDLKGFDKLFLQPGEKKTVTIEVTAENISYSVGAGKFYAEQITYNVIVGSSSTDVRQTGSFRISTSQAEIDAAENSENGKSGKIPGFEACCLIAGIAVACLLARKNRL